MSSANIQMFTNNWDELWPQLVQVRNRKFCGINKWLVRQLDLTSNGFFLENTADTGNRRKQLVKTLSFKVSRTNHHNSLKISSYTFANLTQIRIQYLLQRTDCLFGTQLDAKREFLSLNYKTWTNSSSIKDNLFTLQVVLKCANVHIHVQVQSLLLPSLVVKH